MERRRKLARAFAGRARDEGAQEDSSEVGEPSSQRCHRNRVESTMRFDIEILVRSAVQSGANTTWHELIFSTPLGRAPDDIGETDDRTSNRYRRIVPYRRRPNVGDDITKTSSLSRLGESL